MALLLFAEGTANLSDQNKMSKCKTDDFLPKFIRCAHKDFTWKSLALDIWQIIQRKKKTSHTTATKNQRKKKLKLPSPVWSVMYFCFKNLLIPDKPEFWGNIFHFKHTSGYDFSQVEQSNSQIKGTKDWFSITFCEQDQDYWLTHASMVQPGLDS